MSSLSEFISQRLSEMNLSERELAKRCGVSHSYINQLVKGINPATNKNINPTIKTLEKIALGIEVPIETLEKVARGITVDGSAQKAFQTNDILEAIEKNVSRSGIPVGTKGDRVIPWELWDQIKEANKMFSCLGVDPSKVSEEHWERLLEDINLVVKLHIQRSNDQK